MRAQGNVKRRDFLMSAGAVMAGLSLDRRNIAKGFADRQQRGGRLVFPINRNWRFSPQRSPNDTAPGFNDSHLERVTIPHTNKRLPWHSFNDKSYQFVSLYRRHFRLPPEARGYHVFVDFAGAMTASTVWLNGQRLGEYKGGYTPFSFDLTPQINWSGDNVLAVELDSTERADIPPFGGEIDYLTFGGIYRDVALRLVPATYIENIFAKPRSVLTASPGLDVSCFISQLKTPPNIELDVELRDGSRVVARGQTTVPPSLETGGPLTYEVKLDNLGGIKRWDLAAPYLYTVVVRLKSGGTIIDEDQRRIGFRQAQFTDHGFELNGNVIKLRGLNRHQTFPFVGQAMPPRVQRRDAEILKKELKINVVRTSHYPQSAHFLDACDELGLLVFEEIPGWQHIGDEQWKQLAVANVGRMIRRDWNHPSVILWGVRINESPDDHDFYTRTNALAHSLDPTRQTGGVRFFQSSEFLEDVFTMNDFGFPLKPPNHPRYLNTEFIGHTYVTKMYDSGDRLTEHTLRHARVHNQLASNPQYAGGLGWCAFDYDTHYDFGSGDRICYHGVCDIFRLPKPAAGFYKSQCDPAEEVVLVPTFDWSTQGDLTNALEHGVVCSNCDHLKFYVGDKLLMEADPDRTNFGNLPHPLYQVQFKDAPEGDLRIEGYIAGRKVIEKKYSARGVDKQLVLRSDDTTLRADGADSTRVWFMVTDEYGNLRRYSSAAIEFSIDGPAEIIGDNPFSLSGGCGAIWIRARETPGTVRLKATHPVLGAQELTIRIDSAEREPV